MRRPTTWAVALLALTVCFTGSVGAAPSEPVPTPEDILRSFRIAPGYEVNLYASELEAPLGNPMAMAFDAAGRLWVATSPTYPQYTPGSPPRDQLIVLEDSDRDGRADRHSVFADNLLVPTGFAIDGDGVYLAQQPNVWLLEDRDGDLRADRKTVILHGFGTEDSHHSISAFTWGPGGAFTFNEGVFHHSQIETPHGPVRARDAAVFRFKPSSGRLTVISHRGYNNPWGHAYDLWGQSILSDASDGAHYNFASVIAAFDYPNKSMPAVSLFRRGRPMAGNLFLSSSHFPPEVQQTHLNNQCIGFHGVRWDRLTREDSGWRAEALPDLLSSPLPHFRPVAAAIGGDGALYILDFCNGRIGHMQFSHRDPGRDHSHGRIWRVTARDRALLEPPSYTTAPTRELLALLGSPNQHERHFARRELQTRDQIEPAFDTWIGALAAEDPQLPALLLEALWIRQGRDEFDPLLLARVIQSPEPRARAGAYRVLRHWIQAGMLKEPEALAHLQRGTDDPDAHVRLEAIVACGFLESAEAAGTALIASQHPMDANLDIVLQQTLRVLEKYGEPKTKHGRQFQLLRLPAPELAALAWDTGVALARASRSDVKLQTRQAAVAWLAQEWQTHPVSVLCELLERVDLLSGSVVAIESALAEQSQYQLASSQARLQSLARDARQPETRDAALRTLLRSGVTLKSVQSWLEDPTQAFRALRALASAGETHVLERNEEALLAELETALRVEQAPPGRFLRISLPRPGPLTLAEVQLWRNGRNVAVEGTATQSQTAWGGVAQRAIDGNTDGAWANNTSTHTPENDPEPWWELDLGKELRCDRVVVWNRTDTNLGERLSDFRIEWLDEERTVVWERSQVPAPSVSRAFEFAPSPQTRHEIFRTAVRLQHQRATVFAALADVSSNGSPLQAARARAALHEVPIAEWPSGFEAHAPAQADPTQREFGRRVYEREGVCGTCHKSDGMGESGAYPPLVASSWVTDDPGDLARIVLHGLQGPLEVHGEAYSSSMAPLGAVLSDQEIAAVLTYVRSSWGNQSSPVAANLVSQIRRSETRDRPWTVSELRSRLASSENPTTIQAVDGAVVFILGVLVVLTVVCVRIAQLSPHPVSKTPKESP